MDEYLTGRKVGGRVDMQWVLDQAVDLFKEELGDNLVGIYLHGSLAMGCFNPDTSDIDLLLVVADKLTRDHMRRLAKKIITFHDGMPNRQGLELSLVLESSRGARLSASI